MIAQYGRVKCASKPICDASTLWTLDWSQDTVESICRAMPIRLHALFVMVGIAKLGSLSHFAVSMLYVKFVPSEQI